jgi:hypothetical protein
MIKKRFSEQEDAFFRKLCIPEEDRHRYTSSPWDGSFRFFRAENVICLEHYQRSPAAPAVPKTKPAA